MDVIEALETLVIAIVIIFFFALLYHALSFSHFAQSMLVSLAGAVGIALVVSLVIGLYVYWRTAIQRKE